VTTQLQLIIIIIIIIINLVCLVDIRFSESTFSGSQVVTRAPNETLLYIIESSVRFELRIAFGHQKVE
jgi:hypothetical protein